MSLPHRLIVPTDFSTSSEAALDYALGLASRIDHASIMLLHAFQAPGIDLPEGILAGTAEGTDRILRAAERTLASAVESRRGGNVAIETAVECGTPWRVIVDHAAKLDGALIIIGSHGRRGFARALLGSVAEKVVRMATCPVLVIPRELVEVDGADR